MVLQAVTIATEETKAGESVQGSPKCRERPCFQNNDRNRSSRCQGWGKTRIGGENCLMAIGFDFCKHEDI